MTTAPTPSDAERLAGLIEKGPRRQGDALIAAELRLLQAENERLITQVHKLEMDALDLASENSILKRQEPEELEARKPLPLSYRSGVMTSGFEGGATVSLHFNDMAEAEAWFVEITDQFDAHGITGGSS